VILNTIRENNILFWSYSVRLKQSPLRNKFKNENDTTSTHIRHARR